MDEVASTPFYYDPTYLTVFISALALILSQVPPVLLWFKDAKLNFEIYSAISLTQKLGNPTVAMHTFIENTGGRKVRVKSLSLDIKRDNTLIKTLPVTGYLKETHDEKETLFTGFSLEPGQSWDHIVLFFQPFNREDEVACRAIEANLKENLRDINEARLLAGDHSQTLTELDPVHVTQAQQFFDDHYIWEAGEYTITLKIQTDKKSLDISKNYNFVLFESQLVEFTTARERLKYGSGIWWQMDNLISYARVEIKEA